MAQAIITTTVVLRGQFQTLPVALYGWKLALDNGQGPSIESAVYSANFLPPTPAPRAFAGVSANPLYLLATFEDLAMLVPTGLTLRPVSGITAGQPFAAELPKYALEALRPLLEIWDRAAASERRLRDETLTKEQLQAVSSPLTRAHHLRLPFLLICSVKEQCVG